MENLQHISAGLDDYERKISRNLLSRHDHTGPATRDVMENCGACVLNGFGDGGVCPNYAGWARVYVQAGRDIPAKYARAFIAELDSENRRYAEALRDDIVKYGIVIG